jgi:hypothetical protein
MVSRVESVDLDTAISVIAYDLCNVSLVSSVESCGKNMPEWSAGNNLNAWKKPVQVFSTNNPRLDIQNFITRVKKVPSLSIGY